jgi:GNAT superfamily N-acetyltransferase
MLSVRSATVDDSPLIADMIRELAAYERQQDEVTARADNLARDGFGPHPFFECVIAEWDGSPAGFAFYYFIYSTWKGAPGLHLEDLFVRAPFRGKGIGKAFLAHLARVAVARNCYGIRWHVLAWNQDAINFYRALGATVLEDWRAVRLDGDALENLAREDGQRE